jgi:hypothetical protein
VSTTPSASGRRAARQIAISALAVLALLVPVGFLSAQVWSSTGEALSFNTSERRGAEYVRPLTELLSVTTDAQSEAVGGRPVDVAALQSAVAAVDEVDRRYGDELGTLERWTAIKQGVGDLTSRSWPVPSAAFAQYSDLVTQMIELTRKVGDESRLILDPELDGYYLTNAAMLRIPDILVDSGRYLDLVVLAGSPSDDRVKLAQLTTARNRVASNAADLGEGLVKALSSTRSDTLGAGLTRPLDEFRTAVDTVAPSNSLLAPASEGSPGELRTDQDELQRSSLALQRAALSELGSLLETRRGGVERTRLLALLVVVLALLVVAGVLAWLWRTRPGSFPTPQEPDPSGRHTRPSRTAPAGPAGAPTELVGAGGRQHGGGGRAAR